MNRKLWSALLAIGLASAVLSDPKGIPPRLAPDKYAAHTEVDGVGIGAELLTSNQARKAFASDMNRCCLIVEIALYPQKDKLLTLALDDFALQAAGKNNPARPLTANAVAAMLRKDSLEVSDVTVEANTGANVGVGKGTAVNNGSVRPTTVHTVGEQAGISVGGAIGDSDGSSGESEQRQKIESELEQKGLPEGPDSAAVAGYLYFPLSVRTKGVALELTYDLNGEPLVLALP